MGTKVQIDNYMPGHCSMRDLSREPNVASWPLFYSDDNLPNGQFYYGFLSKPSTDLRLGYDKDVVKQTMLEHEAIFKKQVYELHRLYRVQRDLMDEVRRKEPFLRQVPYEASSSSSPVPSQMQYEDLQTWNGANPSLASSICGRPPYSGADTTAHSSPYSAKGKNIQAGPSPFQNCYSPRNSEVSESRPTKFRRRMLDLQLPADEYIDTDEVEQYGDTKVSDNTIPSQNKNRPLGSDLGKSKVLADLNEPLHVEETTVVSSVDLLGEAGSRRDIQCSYLSNTFLRSSKDVPQNSRHRSLNGALSNSPLENGQKSQDWFCYALDSEQHKGGFRSINQGIHEQKLIIPSQTIQIPLDQPPAFLTGDHTKGDLWKAKYGGTVEKSDRSYSLSSYGMPEQTRLSHLPSQPSFFHHSDFGKSWDQCASSGDKLSSCLNQRSIQIQTTPFLTSATLSKSPLSSDQNNNFFGTKWNLNSIPGASAPFGSEPSLRSGFYHGSSASFREPPVHFSPAGFDYTHCNYRDKDLPLKDVNLNVAIPNGVSNDHSGNKSEDPLILLPWLRRKASGHDNSDNSRKGLSALESAQVGGLPFATSSSTCEVKPEKPESNGCLGSKRILGVPIFESPSLQKENSMIINPSAVGHQSGNKEVESSRKRVVFDMNVPCDPEPTDSETASEDVVIIEKKMQTESATLRSHFDLNSCITEEETPCGTSLLGNSACIKRGTGIDLEAPVIIESDEEPFIKEPEKQPEREDDSEPELAKSAAEAIIAISSSVNLNPPEGEATCLPAEATLEDALHWFVDIACSSGNDLESQQARDEGDRSGDNGGCSPRVLDDFESMTLSLKECSAEEYFPKPSFPEIPNIEETRTCLLTARTRKGQARRGRQRRDFQRDILPGLASLSRHEVTEDLQTFGGLMRATGHPWHSGPNRRNATRNGCGRGRRRSVVAALPPATVIPTPLKQQSSSNAEVGLEDRSLTGWGKTTRRPRRQRCPAGNPPVPVPLS
ncbi:hypothetical protein Cgig2_031318 [Carnegiea gigantea]|uniref:Uncharacterized protein n=1 Tax=Carnegiea gigantea TaxID=171969 RepID=A0A9Q1KKX5_9CARY|nr:hypothetical protein Cgig2_031318 [Carnegiea gigantea]